MDRLGGEQLLVDDLIQDLAEHKRSAIQRLALTDQALGHRLTLHVGGPDRCTVDHRHGLVAWLWGAIRGGLLAAGEQQHEAGHNAPAPYYPADCPACRHSPRRSTRPP